MATDCKKIKLFKNPFTYGYCFVRNRYANTHAYFTSHDIQAKHVYYILFLLTILPFWLLYPTGLKAVLTVALYTSPIWFTITIIIMIWFAWIDYIQLLFLADPRQEGQLYEIVIPKDITKSPAAMELFFEGLLLTQGETTGFDLYWKGRVRPWYSLEITGIDGEVRMYLWCWKRITSHVEAQLYGQYPDVKLVPVDDYAAKVDYDPKKQFAWGMRYKLTKDDELPIKTYYEFGLHENADKWETKVDPMVNILEKFALAQKGEQIWVQILFQKSDRDVSGEAQKLIEKIHDDSATEYPSMADPDEMVKGFPMLLPADREKVDSVQRASKKPAFDCVMRGLYLTDLDVINTHRIQSVIKMFANYNGLNSFGVDGDAPGGDYPWQDYTLPNPDTVLKNFINAYRLRSGFRAPFKRPVITLTTEELATLFHFPSQEGAVPGMNKEQSKGSTAPTNLPI